MNTNRLKRFARSARSKLMAQVAAKLEYVLTADSALLREKAEQVSSLREELNRTGKAQLIEKVAYTWFNRLVALRFMDVNDFQPLGLRIVTPKNGFTLPEILDEAKRGNFPPEFNIQHSAFKITRIEDLLYGKIPSSNPQNEVYRELLIAVCNHLNTVFPFLFEKINDYTELLLPDDLTSEFSILEEIREGMDADDCIEVEIIGWLYQFYIAEKKDVIFASKIKVKKEDIPAVTQLFTPHWIVEYMVQNTVGKLWLQNRPNSGLKQFMPYYIESASSNIEDYLKINSPEEITLLDPAMGSGHILVYGFELLTKIYEEEGYNHSEIPELIIRNNLFGFEIDERAAQLADFALMMKARQYHRRFFNKPVAPKTFVLEDLTLKDQEIKDTINNIGYSPSRELLHDLSNMQQASNFGSLVIPKTQMSELERILEKLKEKKLTSDLFVQQRVEVLNTSIAKLIELKRKFCCVVTNPPYMGTGNMNNALGDFVKINYPDSKADLMTCFVEAGCKMLYPKGTLGMINFASWMFLSSFEKFRNKIIEDTQILTLNHNGRGVFGSDFGTACFVLQNIKNSEHVGVYRKLFTKQVQVRTNEKIIELFLDKSFGYFEFKQSNFNKIPGKQIAYWISNNMLRLFDDELLNKHLISGGRCKSYNDKKFVFQLWEVNHILIGSKWKLYENGGDARKWYGNLSEIIDWSVLAQKFYKSKGGLTKNEHWEKIGVVWNMITYNVSFRLKSKNVEYSSGCTVLFAKKNSFEYNETLGYLNSKIVSELLKILNPTVNTSVGVVLNIPYKLVNTKLVNEIVHNSINISSRDWESKETSFDFLINELIRIKGNNLELAYHLYQQHWTAQFFQLHQNEEALNRQFIEIYNMQEELTPHVPLEDITILQQELDRSNLAKLNKKLSRDPHTYTVLNYNEINLPFDGKEVMAQFISYCVNCMFGRYSLDKEGLILANQGETLKVYLEKVSKSKQDIQFLPDDDNIIPMLEDEWFEDDITGRFNQFLKITFGTENFSKNLSFVEECLGKDVRSWFIKDFYSDHIKRYKKRPIYWMFSSPNGSFNVLIYMHRYTPDTLNLILNKYLRPFQDKLRSRREYLVSMQGGGQRSAVGGLEIAKAIKEQDKIDKILLELKEYEREVFYPLALERIKIDLDDGVLVNYNKFGRAVRLVPGLNDPETKKKVRGFDWVDGSEIRD